MQKFSEEQKLLEEEKLREEEELKDQTKNYNHFVSVYGEIPANLEGGQYETYYPSLTELVDYDEIHPQISQYIAMQFLNEYSIIPKSKEQLLLNKYIKTPNFQHGLNTALQNSENVKNKIYFAYPTYKISREDTNGALELINLNAKPKENPLNNITPKKLRDRTKIKPIDKYTPTKTTKGSIGGFVTTKRGKK